MAARDGKTFARTAGALIRIDGTSEQGDIRRS